jgi:hypothetical protein
MGHLTDAILAVSLWLNRRLEGSATHIITSTGLSGSKTAKFLNANLKRAENRYVVKPEWLFDSIREGKRLDEYAYRAVVSKVQSEIWFGGREGSSSKFDA